MSFRALRRAAPRLRRSSRGVYRLSRTSRFVVRVRGRRVRAIAVANRSTLRSPRALRFYLRRAGA